MTWLFCGARVARDGGKRAVLGGLAHWGPTGRRAQGKRSIRDADPSNRKMGSFAGLSRRIDGCWTKLRQSEAGPPQRRKQVQKGTKADLSCANSPGHLDVLTIAWQC